MDMIVLPLYLTAIWQCHDCSRNPENYLLNISFPRVKIRKRIADEWLCERPSEMTSVRSKSGTLFRADFNSDCIFLDIKGQSYLRVKVKFLM
jgi:hypothetical protein